MNTKRATKSEVAVAAAMEAIGPCNPRTAAALLFIGAARNLQAVVQDDRWTSSLAYTMADEIATGLRK